MGDLLLAMFSWLGFLQRPDVQKQLVVIGLAMLLGRWLVQSPWLGWMPRMRWIKKPSIPLAEEVALVVAIPLLIMAGQQSGLVLLVAQIKAAWLSLGLVEHQLLNRWLDPVTASRLSSRLLRPALLLSTVLIGLDAVDNLQELSNLPLGRLFGSATNLGSLFQVAVVLYVLAIGSGPPATALGWLCQRGLEMGDGRRRAFGKRHDQPDPPAGAARCAQAGTGRRADRPG